MSDEKKTSPYTGGKSKNDAGGNEPSKDLDRYGVWIKSDPQTLGEPDDAGDIFDEEALNKEIMDDFSKSLDMPQGTAKEETAPDLYDADALTQKIDDFSKTLGIADEAPLPKETFAQKEDAAAPPPPADLYDADALTQKIDDFSKTLGIADEAPLPKETFAQKEDTAAPPPAPETVREPCDMQILTRIAEELTAIKQEITGFKTIFLQKMAEEKAEKTAGRKTAPARGDPEKIVLAGNELDNIFNGGLEKKRPAPPAEERVHFLEEEELSAEDLDFLKTDAAAASSFDSPSAAPDRDKDILLENEEGLQWLRKEGDKPISQEKPALFDDVSFEIPKKGHPAGGAPSNSPAADQELIDDLLIESGSIKDMPVALDDGEEFDEEEFDQEEEPPDADDYLPDDLASVEIEVPLGISDRASGKVSFDEEPLAHVIFSDDRLDLSDEELDRIEQDALREFAEKTPAVPAEGFPFGDGDTAERGAGEEYKEKKEYKERKPAETPPDAESKKKLKNPRGITSLMRTSETMLSNFKTELKIVLSYMDQLLEALPDTKIEEFAASAHFDTYKKLFNELALG
ncbi:MAG: hypothetical protein LBD24_03540 [Spirochaetaceae bacterium]|jgi:hypothetical protein|nr:hypothetical protein [Spirochaetaceae bacterium]